MEAVLDDEKIANNWFRLGTGPVRFSVPDTRSNGNGVATRTATVAPFTPEEQNLYRELTLYRYGSYYS